MNHQAEIDGINSLLEWSESATLTGCFLGMQDDFF